MDIWIKFVVLVVVSYLFGSIPASYLVGRWRGKDMRKQGTGQVGAGNLWRTTSRRLGLLVGVYDFLKGAVMISIAWRMGLDPGLQLSVGLAVVVGHNWPVFLRFHGGRGIATCLGIIIIMPCINIGEITTWPLVAFFGVLAAGVVIYRHTPVPILIGLILLPIISRVAAEPLSLNIAYVAMFVIIVTKRLTAQPAPHKREISMGRLLMNRLLYDRDIGDRAAWVHRKNITGKDTAK
jgi:acyl phosphate:glycerol-3-phosphate acyltransferase